MKHLFLATALLASGLSLSAQTPVTPPFSGEKRCQGIAFPSSNSKAFYVREFGEEPEYAIFDMSLSKVFSLSGADTDKITDAYILDATAAIPYDESDDCWFSQTLFNDDDAFEYFFADDYNKETFTCTKVSLRSSASKEPIFVLEPGEDLYALNVELVYFGKDCPIYIILETSNVENNLTFWYKYEPKTGAVEKVAAESVPTLVARPNPVKAGEVVNLDLKGVYDQCNVALFTMRGELVKTLTTTDGTLNTSGLTPGHYLYKVAGNGRQVGTGKLIIK